jgi:hypothetical protein
MVKLNHTGSVKEFFDKVKANKSFYLKSGVWILYTDQLDTIQLILRKIHKFLFSIVICISYKWIVDISFLKNSQ